MIDIFKEIEKENIRHKNKIKELRNNCKHNYVLISELMYIHINKGTKYFKCSICFKKMSKNINNEK